VPADIIALSAGGPQLAIPGTNVGLGNDRNSVSLTPRPRRVPTQKAKGPNLRIVVARDDGGCGPK